jgi:aldehyde:ferredoxin oxidoreductase
MNAVLGKILWVDLTKAEIHEESVPPEVYEHFLSGLGLAAYYLYQRIPPGAKALGPQNILAFVSGLLTGTGSMMTGRWMAAAKSPLTGTWGDANCGGTLSPLIKHCGYDGIFFSGISPEPVYLYLTPEKAELCSAANLWGKDTRETETILKQRHAGPSTSVACIGPAGEKLSLIAGIANDQGRMAARSGLGAVMGAKRLKALVLQGNTPIPVADPDEMARLSEKFRQVVSFQPPFLNGWAARWLGTLLRWLPLQMRQDGMLYKFFLQKYGTSGLNQYSVETGDAPVRNWAGSNHDFTPRRSASIDPDRVREREISKYHCYSCPIGCGGITYFNDQKSETHKPEYETILALSGLLLNNDLESLFVMNEMLNRAGMDSISAGGTLAFAIECFENGLLTREALGGLELTWGNTSAILQLLEMMIKREGLGDLLADGSKLAAERIGQGSEQYAVHAGGQELAMHDGRNDPGFTLHAALEPTPGRHTIGSYLYYEMYQLWRRVKKAPHVYSLFYLKTSKFHNDAEKARWSALSSQFSALLNGAGGCMFGAFLGVHRFPIFEWLNAATGWQKSPEDYLQIGWNIQSVRQAFNVREKIILKHTINPRPAGNPPLKKGANRGNQVPLEKLTQIYWQEMGWDSKGRPPASALSDLGLPPPEI